MRATKFVGISFAGAVLAGAAIGLSASANADDNCDPLLLSMTPQPVAACGEVPPDVAPPPPDAAIAPISDIGAPPAEGVLPAEVPPPAEPGPFGEVEPPAPALLPDGSAG